jgi:gamma-F420-2:alpha-L-glutamate ligase
MSVWILSKQPATYYENERLLAELTARNIKVQLMNPDNFDLIVNKNVEQSIFYNGNPVDLPKIMLVRQGAGSSSFMLAVINQLEHAGVRCINTADSIDTVQNKLKTAQLLSSNNIATPNTMMVRFPVDVNLVDRDIGFPCVVKVTQGSYGEGIFLCEKRRDLAKLMEFINTIGTNKTLLIQEYLGERVGEDLRVLVVGGKVIGAMKRTAPDGDFRANITNGGTGELFPVCDEIEYIARETARVFNLDIAGVDLLFHSNGFRVLEVNSNPGFKGFDKFCNANIAEVIAEYIGFKLL